MKKISNLVVIIIEFLGFLVALPVYGQASIADKEAPIIKETFTYKVVDKHSIQADVYRYPGETIRPGIFWIHGGALIFGTRNWLDSRQLKLYLDAGYTVVAIDYRLAPETKLPGIIEDLQNAWTWVREQGPVLFHIDPNRIAVIGHSAGGYLTLMSGFCLNPAPQALVSFYGYGDITGPWYSQPDSFYSQSPAIATELAFAAVGDTLISGTETEISFEARLQFYLYCRQQGQWPIEVCGHDPALEYAWFKEYEPLRNITSAYPPTMLLHGEKDTDVPFAQSVKMAEALQKFGVEHEFTSRPDWDHGFDDDGMDDAPVKDAFDRILAFLGKHTGKVSK